MICGFSINRIYKIVKHKIRIASKSVFYSKKIQHVITYLNSLWLFNDAYCKDYQSHMKLNLKYLYADF